MEALINEPQMMGGFYYLYISRQEVVLVSKLLWAPCYPVLRVLKSKNVSSMGAVLKARIHLMVAIEIFIMYFGTSVSMK